MSGPSMPSAALIGMAAASSSELPPPRPPRSPRLPGSPPSAPPSPAERRSMKGRMASRLAWAHSTRSTTSTLVIDPGVSNPVSWPTRISASRQASSNSARSSSPGRSPEPRICIWATAVEICPAISQLTGPLWDMSSRCSSRKSGMEESAIPISTGSMSTLPAYARGAARRSASARRGGTLGANRA